MSWVTSSHAGSSKAHGPRPEERQDMALTIQASGRVGLRFDYQTAIRVPPRVVIQSRRAFGAGSISHMSRRSTH